MTYVLKLSIYVCLKLAIRDNGSAKMIIPRLAMAMLITSKFNVCLVVLNFK